MYGLVYMLMENPYSLQNLNEVSTHKVEGGIYNSDYMPKDDLYVSIPYQLQCKINSHMSQFLCQKRNLISQLLFQKRNYLSQLMHQNWSLLLLEFCTWVNRMD
ncbi:hypothetical protein NMG60_11005108 [Bertholletia excelsa]